MKIVDLKPVYEAFEQDFSAQAGSRWNDQELELAFQAVKKAEMSKEEVSDTAREMTERDGFDRTVAGAEFALNRMHILVHGSAPQGETESRAEKMFGIPDTMLKFANKKGYDTVSNIRKAKIDLKGRPVRRKEADAKQMMSQYFMANKVNLPKDIAQHREAIIADLMAGLSPEEAFGRYFQREGLKHLVELSLRRKKARKPTVVIDTLSGEDKAKVLDIAKEMNVKVLSTEGPVVTFDLDRESLESAMFLSKIEKEAQWDIL